MSLPNLEVAAGRIRSYPLPPSGFDPRAASPLELRRYGLPQRPDPSIRPELAERWDQVFSRRLTYILPTFRPMQELLPGIQRRSRIRQDLVTGTHGWWSEGVAHAPTGVTFNWVLGQLECPGCRAARLDRY